MSAWIECVPNFSEGRDPAVLVALVAAVRDVEGARVLDASQDPDHNRAVVTFAAPPERVGDAAFAAIAVALERIDLRGHAGVHPRMGAADVVPFVPLEGTTMERCIAVAHQLGRRVGSELGLPVFFYGAAALRPGRRLLPDVRRGGFERLRASMGSDPELAPDAGPPTVHPSGGATAIGARPILIAFNVNLATGDVAVARAIARRVRERDGGLSGIRALGLFLEGPGLAQVSTNVCDFERTGLVRLYEEIERLARDHGVEPEGSELVGLAPRAALDREVARRVRLKDFDPARHVIENVLEEKIG